MLNSIYLKTKIFFPSFFACYGCEEIIFDEIEKSNALCLDDPPIFDCVST